MLSKSRSEIGGTPTADPDHHPMLLTVRTEGCVCMCVFSRASRLKAHPALQLPEVAMTRSRSPSRSRQDDRQVVGGGDMKESSSPVGHSRKESTKIKSSSPETVQDGSLSERQKGPLHGKQLPSPLTSVLLLHPPTLVRGLLGTDTLDPALESASPSPPVSKSGFQRAILARFCFSVHFAPPLALSSNDPLFKSAQNLRASAYHQLATGVVSKVPPNLRALLTSYSRQV